MTVTKYHLPFATLTDSTLFSTVLMVIHLSTQAIFCVSFVITLMIVIIWKLYLWWITTEKINWTNKARGNGRNPKQRKNKKWGWPKCLRDEEKCKQYVHCLTATCCEYIIIHDDARSRSISTKIKWEFVCVCVCVLGGFCCVYWVLFNQMKSFIFIACTNEHFLLTHTA